MDSSILLVNAYNLLQTANENLRRLQVELVRVSGLWTLFQDNPETRSSDRPEYWVDSAGQSDSFRNEDADAWVFDARSRGLFRSTSALVEELRSLGERKRNLEDIQQKLRLTINTVSRPSLRSLHILDLPDEILSRVFDFVEGYRPDIPSLWHIVSRDLKNCRLACRAFCRVSSRLFLRSVSVDLRVSSISRFEEISRHPIISKGVRVVRAVLHFYDPRLSENFDDFILHSATELEQRVESMEWMKTWEFHKVSEKDGLRVIEKLKAISASWRRISSAIQAQNLTEDDHQHLLLLRKAHQKYQRLFSDQEELLNSGMFLQKVAAGIDRMPRARILHFLDWDFNLPREVSPFDCEDLNVPVYEAPLRAMNYYTAYKYGFTPRLCDTIATLPVAIHHRGVRLERIGIKLSYVDPPTDLLPSSETRQQLPYAMQQLQKFSFECRRWVNGESNEEIFSKIFEPFLDTPSLRELNIDLSSEEESDNQSNLEVGKLITLQPWRVLSRIFLREVAFNLSEFQLFLSKNEEPSFDLTLDRVRLLSGTWGEALDGLRKKSVRIIQLSDLLGAECDNMSSSELSSIFGKEDSRAWSEAELYIKKVKHQNPLRSS